jgi:hypothetical protein
VPGLVELMTDVRSRKVRVVDVQTETASPFAQSLLFGYVGQFLYEGDAPLAERRAQALALDTGLLAEPTALDSALRNPAEGHSGPRDFSNGVTGRHHTETEAGAVRKVHSTPAMFVRTGEPHARISTRGRHLVAERGFHLRPGRCDPAEFDLVTFRLAGTAGDHRRRSRDGGAERESALREFHQPVVLRSAEPRPES